MAHSVTLLLFRGPQNTSISYLHIMSASHAMWMPVTTGWRVLGLHMEDTASRYGR